MQAGVFYDIEREKGSRDVVCCRILENPILLKPIHVVRFVVLSSTFFLVSELVMFDDSVGIPLQLDLKMIRTICHHLVSMRVT